MAQTLLSAVGRDLKNELQPQFINLTNSASMDSSARTSVRVQVMRQYHKKRIDADGKAIPPVTMKISSLPVLSAKAQTRKFRLGQEKVLRPWTPVKARPKKDGKHKVSPQRNSGVDVLSISDQGLDFSAVAGLDVMVPSGEVETSQELIERTDVGRYLSFHSNSQFVPLYQTPDSGSLDPFSSMSVRITPRMKMLIHHYCKLNHFPQYNTLTPTAKDTY